MITMNACCKEIQPFLFRVNEGEATPEQAIQVARHLSDCTACRITGAREKRLAEVLSSELEDLPVGEDFVDAVMGTLPQELPKRKRRIDRKKWHGLKLASFGGFVGLLALEGTPGWSGGLSLPARMLPQFTAESAPTIPGGVLELARIVTSVAGAVTGGASLEAPSIAISAGLLAATALGGVLTLAGTSAVLALAVRSLLRQS
jgi:anti-sigma factor RsiW